MLRPTSKSLVVLIIFFSELFIFWLVCGILLWCSNICLGAVICVTVCWNRNATLTAHGSSNVAGGIQFHRIRILENSKIDSLILVVFCRYLWVHGQISFFETLVNWYLIFIFDWIVPNWVALGGGKSYITRKLIILLLIFKTFNYLVQIAENLIITNTLFLNNLFYLHILGLNALDCSHLLGLRMRRLVLLSLTLSLCLILTLLKSGLTSQGSQLLRSFNSHIDTTSCSLYETRQLFEFLCFIRVAIRGISLRSCCLNLSYGHWLRFTPWCYNTLLSFDVLNHR